MSNDDVTITKTPLMPVDAMRQRGPMQSAYRQGRIITKPIYELTFWEKVRLIPALFTIMKGYLMGDMKTTISGVVKVAFQLATIFGIGFGAIDEAMITGVLWGIASIYQAYQTADKK